MNPPVAYSHMDRAPIFIAGCGRSGTTYLRSILAAHPDLFFIPQESLYLLDYLRYGRFTPSALLTRLFYNEPQLKWYKGKRLPLDPDHTAVGIRRVYSEAARATGAQMWGQKTPRFVRHMRLFDRCFGHINWLLIYRDPRAVVTSMLKSERHTYSLARACNRWLLDNRLIVDLLQGHTAIPPNIFLVKYEDLIRHFEQTTGALFDFLGVPPLFPGEIIQRGVAHPFKGYQFDSNSVREGLRPQTKFIHAWQEFLSADQRRYIEMRCAGEMEILGYTPVTGHSENRHQYSNGLAGTGIRDAMIPIWYLSKWPRYLFHTGCRKIIFRFFHLRHRMAYALFKTPGTNAVKHEDISGADLVSAQPGTNTKVRPTVG